LVGLARSSADSAGALNARDKFTNDTNHIAATEIDFPLGTLKRAA